MSIFDIILVQPIFNILVVIYGLLPGQDFGIALIIFTIIVRLLMWPLVKKQLHHTKIMRQMQPELVKIKKRAKGNRQLEAQMMKTLYEEKGVNPFAAMGTLLLQLPIFIALFAVVKLITETTKMSLSLLTISLKVSRAFEMPLPDRLIIICSVLLILLSTQLTPVTAYIGRSLLWQ